MKFILILVVFICCIYIGFAIKEYFLKRERFFISLVVFLENISNNILFNNEKLINILQNMNKETLNKDFKNFIDLYINFLTNKINFNEFRRIVEKNFNYLNEFEKNRFLQFLYNLGSQTKEEELKKINIFIKEISNLKDESINKNKLYSSLYLKLFVSLGLILFIIFI